MKLSIFLLYIAIFVYYADAIPKEDLLYAGFCLSVRPSVYHDQN